ncbi:Pep7 protein [Starmerella bacillaris]|uniref:Pep7 protein n=1 Tax=Starmerella bacillaris TaxID=1247836 RepID=A0AAV5RN71_STABA|nr:Pep7 protein [Starmerella bacillaris]
MVVLDKSEQFLKLRCADADRKAITRTKTENRLVRILLGVQKLCTQAGYSDSGFWGWSQVDKIRKFEQEVVVWEDGTVFERCRFCGQKFTLFNRQHHCRVCGLVVCGDLERECSLEVPCNMLAEKLNIPEVESVDSVYPLRMCTECRRVVFSARNFERDCRAPAPAVLRLHQQLKRNQREISALMPVFEAQLKGMDQQKSVKQKNGSQDASGSLAELKRTRHALLKLFSNYEKITRRVQGLHMDTHTEQVLKDHCVAEASQYMERAMAPLQNMNMPVAMQYNERRSRDRDEILKLQNQILVMEEQQFLLENQLMEAKSRRHLDEVVPLEQSLNELSAEITRYHDRLDMLEQLNENI